HSGHAVLFSLSTPYIRADFDTAVNSVSLWYTSASLFYIDAYDAFGSLIGTAGGAGNYGTNSFLQVTSLTANIAYVIMHDSGNYFTIDDFTSDSTSGLPSSVPERGETLFLLSIGVAALIASRRNLLG
ncbi:MAG TPA: hypothetical protein VMO26_27565, partial [Vicinamibacterales bacterium]|nr:hypothetical protein [Vicinamibacterales bacterium]